MLRTSGSLAVRTASVESTCLFLRKTNALNVVNKHSAALFYSPNQEVRMAMQGEFECLLDDDGFRDSNLRLDSMMKTETMSTPRRRLQDATLVRLDGRRSLILNKIDASRCNFVGPRQVGFC